MPEVAGPAVDFKPEADATPEFPAAALRATLERVCSELGLSPSGQ